MKKLYYIMTLMFITLLASCSQEEVMTKVTDNNLVSISAELPGDIAATRAQIQIPASHKLRCIIEVWTKTTTPDLKYRKEVVVEGGSIPTFDFELKPDDYNCLMWADFVKADAATEEVTLDDELVYTHYEDTYYNTADLNAVTIKDEAGINLFNTDLCDGFYANLELKKSEAAVQKAIKLVRPFAKLVVKETDAEKFATLTGLTVRYEVPKAFNVATGEPGAEKLMAVCDKTFEEGDASQVLFTAYIFTPSTGFSVGSTILSFSTKAGKITCEIPGGSIQLTRNQRMVAGGELIAGAGIAPEPDPDPEPEPIGDPKVGDYFFIDGTWSNELTEANKDNCVGIVYAVGAQAGDNIANYGTSAAGKSIKGYVVGLKNTGVPAGIFPGEDAQYLLNSSRPYFYMQKPEGGAKDDAVTVLTKGGNPDWTKYDGFKATQTIFTTSPFLGAADPLHYPAIQIFKVWKEGASKPANASEWYLPASGQLYEVVGKCYGYTPNAEAEGYGAQKMDVNTALLAALDKAIEAGIATNFPASTNVKGYYLYSSTIGPDAMPLSVQVGATQVTTLYSKPNYKTQGLIRPFLTIIK